MLCYSVSSANLREILLLVIQGETGEGEDVGFSLLFSFPYVWPFLQGREKLLGPDHFLFLLFVASTQSPAVCGLGVDVSRVDVECRTLAGNRVLFLAAVPFVC